MSEKLKPNLLNKDMSPRGELNRNKGQAGARGGSLLHPGLAFQGGHGFGKAIAEPVRAHAGLGEGAVEARFFQLEAAPRQALKSDDPGAGFQGMGGALEKLLVPVLGGPEQSVQEFRGDAAEIGD